MNFRCSPRMWWCCLLFLLLAGTARLQAEGMRRVVVAEDRHGFVVEGAGQVFHPWGMNYGNDGRLMEDFWDEDWETLAGDFRELRDIGVNVVRVHLQVGKFMRSATEPDRHGLEQFARLLKLAEETGLRLDVTGLACYRPADVPVWYDALDESARWEVQARFWAAVAEVGASSPAVFCYDLINEPLSPGEKRQPGQWRSGSDLGGYDFLQYIALDLAGRKREDIPVMWIRQLSAAIRQHDPHALITVGMLPWSRQWKHLSGFLPEKVAPELDFISVHIYPDSKLPGEAMECLQHFAVGKPIVIEETFPLSCTVPELEAFFRASRELACGWIGHYDGQPPAEIDALEKAGKMTGKQAIYREWLRLFVRLTPEFTADK
ncbi:MAG TPA: cellulase family glycosylhydrolase [Chthoniobacter sp.]|nr:cellulase family glycosylhydrolase [Chthoniobacter sp.]